MYLLGYDIGSSSVKACLIEAQSGKIVAGDYYPKEEMPITAHKSGWAEQQPEQWWQNLKCAHQSVIKQAGIDPADIKAIGITWQMHGLVLIGKDRQVLRPAIIWCDSRAVPYGQAAFDAIGHTRCLEHLLNSPGNFTAAKLAWVKEHEPHIYDKIDRILLPGDYIAWKLTDSITTTTEALSEGIFWDFKEKKISSDILNHFGFSPDLLADQVPIFGQQGCVSRQAALELGLKEGTPVTYRAGDQPNNALSLNVLKPGEIASTAGTSGVIYGVSDQLSYDPTQRVNSFAHVNYTTECQRIGILLCINSTGILNNWMRRTLSFDAKDYETMNKLAATSPIGARGIKIIPFGNGAERMLNNRTPDCSLHGINFNIHDKSDLLRAAQESIAFSYRYGVEIMQDMGLALKTIKAGYANLYKSSLFCEAISNLTNSTIELYNTDGAAGAARGAGVGAGIYKSFKEAFAGLTKIKTIEPDTSLKKLYDEQYLQWKTLLEKELEVKQN